MKNRFFIASLLTGKTINLIALLLLSSNVALAENTYVYGHCFGWGEKHDLYISSVYRVKLHTIEAGIQNAFNDYVRAEHGDFTTRINCSRHADSYDEATRDRIKDLADFRTDQYGWNIITVNFRYYED